MSSYASATVDYPVYGLPSIASANVPGGTTTIQAHLDRWSDVADGHIQKRISLPIVGPPYPKSLIAAVCDCASYSLLTLTGFNPESPNDAAVLDRFERAEQWMMDVGDGKIVPTFTPVDPQWQLSSDQPRGWYSPDTCKSSGSIR